MKKNLLSKFRIVTQNTTSATILSLCAVAALIVLVSFADGPAKHNTLVTGAPFNSGKTCSQCHSGGSFGGTMVAKLLDANKIAVKSYVPGQLYTLSITIKKTATDSVDYGLQTTCATTTSGLNVNTWGTIPKGLHNILKSSHNYVEHSSPRPKGKFNIPWTGPASGTGSVTFYAAGALVNNNGNTTGDQPVNKALTVSETVAPLNVMFANFNGTIQNNKATLTWTTTLENGITSYTIEKSYNSEAYSAIGSVQARGMGSYSFIDNSFSSKAYYRLKLTDAEGNISYYNSLTLAVPDRNNYQLSLYAHAGAGFINFYNGAARQKVQVIYTDIQGRPIYTYTTEVYEGDNIWQIPQDKVKGITIVNVITADGIRTSLKLASY